MNEIERSGFGPLLSPRALALGTLALGALVLGALALGTAGCRIDPSGHLGGRAFPMGLQV